MKPVKNPGDNPPTYSFFPEPATGDRRAVGPSPAYALLDPLAVSSLDKNWKKYAVISASCIALACLVQLSSKIPLLQCLSEYSFAAVPLANGFSVAFGLYAYKLWDKRKTQEKSEEQLIQTINQRALVQTPSSHRSFDTIKNPMHAQTTITKKAALKAAPQSLQDSIEECMNNPYQWPPVAYAVFRGYHDAAAHFIQQGADVNTKTRDFTIRNKQTQEIMGRQEGFSLIMMAILNEDAELVDLLIEKGCKLDLVIPTYNNDFAMEQESNRIYISCNDSTLHPIETSLQTWAIVSHNEQIIESVNHATEARAEKSFTYDNPIFTAASRGNYQEFAKLLSENKYLLSHDNKLYLLFCLMEGYQERPEQIREQKLHCLDLLTNTVIITPQLLRDVLIRGVSSPESIFLFVEKGIISPNERICLDNNQTLMFFCTNEPELLMYLIRKGADISVVETSCGNHIQHLVAIGSQYPELDVEVLKLLKKHGADLQARNYYGNKPIDYARLYNNTAIIQYLETV